MGKNIKLWKYSKKAISIFMAVMIALATFTSVNKYQDMSDTYAASKERVACWISYIDIGEYLCNKNESDFRRLFGNMCNNCMEQNVDTLLVHVRSRCDAIYPSSYFPWATFINSQGKNPGYDPLSIMVEVAHEKGLRIEAWINPYRVSTTTKSTKAMKETSFYSKYGSLMTEYNSGSETCLTLEPSNQGARDLIVNGVKEIVKNYDVDGIHLDDYFYNNGMGTNLSVSEKMANVNKLVSALYSSVKSIDPTCEFGISPGGNPENVKNAGADVATWASSTGYVDYVMPQLYWSDSYLQSGVYQTLYTNRAKYWMSLKKNSNVKMYVGLALYKVNGYSSGTKDKGWAASTANLKEQYLSTKELGYDGYSLYRYAWLDVAKGYDSTLKYIGLDESYVEPTRIELANLKEAVDSYSGNSEKPEDKAPHVVYTAHSQSFGWLPTALDGETVGTVGLAKRLEAISIKLNNIDGGVKYRSHVQSYGWMDWVNDGAVSGTSGQSKRVEALQIELTGNAAEKYDIYYRVHCQTYGWLDWAKNGEKAGTAGLSKRVEAIEIKLVEKDSEAPGGTATPFISKNVEYSCHVQTYGWQDNKCDGETAGTVGKAKRLEGIKINPLVQDVTGDIVYRTHVQTYGWQEWKKNGEISGTVGKAKRLEAIEIKLTGELAEKYDIYYRVHVQTYGWQEWKKNGETAGTTGESKRLEGIEIKLVKKGQN